MRDTTITVKDIPIKVVYKRVRNLRLSISLRNRTVSVSSPYSVNLSTIEDFIETKYEWIAKHLDRIPIVDKIVYRPGVTLSILETNRVINTKNDLEQIKSEYLDYIKSKITKYSNLLNVSAKGIVIKPLKSRWGSCNTKDKIITINLYLVHSRLEVIDYVVFHELVHLIVKGHNEKFYNFIKSQFPNYKQLDKELKLLQARI